MDYNTIQVQEFHQRFEAILDFLDNLSERAANGELAPLASLDQDIESLCREVKNSDPEIARQVQPVMAQMIARLDTLVDDLQRYRDQLSAQ